MVTFPPLVPSRKWMVHFIKRLAAGDPQEKAILSANERIISPRDFGRFHLMNPKGEIETLSLAVEGGGRQLRDFRKIENLRLSEHGDWRKSHWGAIETCLGRKPFFKELEARLKESYLNRDLSTLKDFNTAIFKTLLAFLIGNEGIPNLADYYKNEIILERAVEIGMDIPTQMCLLEILAIYGREALLGFLVEN